MPKPLAAGVDETESISFLLMEFLDASPRRKDYWETLGRELALMHGCSTERFVMGRTYASDGSQIGDDESGGNKKGTASENNILRYGFYTDNYIGATLQKNTPKSGWIEFFRDCRLVPQLQMAEKQLGMRTRLKCERLLERLDSLLEEPEFPSLLHGDLWSGNVVCGLDGKAWILDPAVYVGNFEAELAMTELFGGYPDSFYRAYLYYFQDMTTHYLHNLGKGNDTLPEEYGICCMYTKYRLHLEKQADYTSPLHMETWLEKNKSTATLYHSFTITKDKETYASGRVESCFFDMKRGCLTRASAVDFPENVGEDCRADVEPFLKKMPKSVDGMEYCYTHTVRYTDLDKMGHMTNLKYVDLLLNAFDSRFYKEHMVTDMEIHYVNQCIEDEGIRVYAQTGEDGIWLLGMKEDGSIAVQGMMKTRKG